jgi:hypothetical protein
METKSMNFLERAFDRQNQWWKYLIVVFVGFLGGQILGIIPLIGLIISKVAASGGAIMPNPSNIADLSALGISKNAGLLLMMLPFIVSLILTAILIKTLHKRTLAETMNGTRQIRYGRFGAGFIVWIVLMIVYYTGDYLLDPDNFNVQFNLTGFIPLLLISILLIPLQTNSVFEQVNLDPVKDALSLIVIGIIVVIYFSFRYKWNYRILLESVKPANDNLNSI